MLNHPEFYFMLFLWNKVSRFINKNENLFLSFCLATAKPSLKISICLVPLAYIEYFWMTYEKVGTVLPVVLLLLSFDILRCFFEVRFCFSYVFSSVLYRFICYQIVYLNRFFMTTRSLHDKLYCKLESMSLIKSISIKWYTFYNKT